MWVFIILFLVPFVTSFDINTVFFKNISVQPHDGKFNYSFIYNITSDVVYLFKYTSNKNNQLPARITTESPDATETFPLLVVVQQQKSVVSWQIPAVIGSEESSLHQFHKTSRTLCPSYSGSNSNDTSETDTFVVMVSCNSPHNIGFTLLAIMENQFYMELDKEVSVNVEPSGSQFFSFIFPEHLSSALLKVNSDSDVCMSLSIQNFSCPVYDQEDDLKYRGYWETVTRKGGMMLTKEAFPQRLFVVFVVHADDKDCTGYPTAIPGREKKVTFSVTQSISYADYLIAMIVVISVFAVTYLTALFLALFCTKKSDSVTFDNDICFVGSTDYDGASSSGKSIHSRGSVVDSNLPGMSSQNPIYREVSLQIFLNVYDLSKEAHEVLKAKSNLYFWNLLTIAIFYSLPVVQLVFTYQKVLNQSGNQDLCYYNFLCSHRLYIISDFNHIFSNIGYILLGILFLLIVYSREKLEDRKETGIPQHYGLYYTLGAALIMEGVLSACYHFCPNHSNFQFDTSFMYILAVISMLKIYQSRHPDINASAYSAFGILALLIFLGMYGVLNGSFTFYFGFTVVHVLMCLFLSAQIYYMGQWNLDRGGRFYMCVITPVRNREEYWWRPLYPSRMVLLILGNICNWGLIWVHLYVRLGDFATYLLAILMTNLLLYFVFYISMKLICGEKIMFHTFLYIVASLICWAAAVYFFIHKSISWKLTPAESRTYNQDCVLFDFYDRHDIWHFLSAMSMFFSFMVLLTLDDDLLHVHRSKIPVF